MNIDINIKLNSNEFPILTKLKKLTRPTTVPISQTKRYRAIGAYVRITSFRIFSILPFFE